MSPMPHAPQKSGLVPLPSHMFVFCLSVCRLFSSYCLEPGKQLRHQGNLGCWCSVTTNSLSQQFCDFFSNHVCRTQGVLGFLMMGN